MLLHIGGNGFGAHGLTGLLVGGYALELAECGCAFTTEGDGQRECGHVVVDEHGAVRELHAGHHLQLYLIAREVVEQLFANKKERTLPLPLPRGRGVVTFPCEDF